MSRKCTAPLGHFSDKGEGPRWPGRARWWRSGEVGGAGMCGWSERPGGVTDEQTGLKRSDRSPGQAGMVTFSEIREAREVRTRGGDVIESAA